MAATYTLNQTTLSFGIGTSDQRISVASAANITPGKFLFIDRECMKVLALGPANGWLDVARGQGDTGGGAHSSSSQVWIADAGQLYTTDAPSSPQASVLVSPWINTSNGKIWWAYGDEVPEGQTYRWSQEQTTTYGVGALGVRTRTVIGPQT